jgi:hypothetical protein
MRPDSEVRSSFVDGWLDMREQRADLSGYFLALDSCLHRSAIGVTHDQNHLGSQNHCAIFQASDRELVRTGRAPAWEMVARW